MVEKMKITTFRGIFMRDQLPKKPKTEECGIINLDNHAGTGTHWVAYYKLNKNVMYFDSFGNLQPPKEFVNYIGSDTKILYNHDRYQDFNTINCGHLCLKFLHKLFEQLRV